MFPPIPCTRGPIATRRPTEIGSPSSPLYGSGQRGGDHIREARQETAVVPLRLGGQEDGERVGLGIEPAERAGRPPVAVGPGAEQVAEVGRMPRPVEPPPQPPGAAAPVLLG